MSSGGLTSDTTYNAGATLNVSSGGTTSRVGIFGSANILSGGAVSGGYVGSGGTVNNYTIRTGWFLSAAAGANISGSNNNSGTVSGGDLYGTLINNSGGLVSGTTITNQGTLTLLSGGNVAGISNYGTVNISSGAIWSNGTVSSGGAANIYSGGVGSVITLSGNANIYSGGLLQSASINSTGNITIYDGGQAISINNSGTITVSSGGSLSIGNGQSLGSITLLNGGSTTVYANNSGTITLSDSKNTGLTISGLENGGSANFTIDGFNGTGAGDSNLITLAGVDPSRVTAVSYPDADHINLILSNADGSTSTITLNIPGIEETGYSLGVSSDGSLTFEVCFLAGSMIKIPGGEVAVEDLRIGHEVLTYDWKNNQEVVRRITWVGNKSIVAKTNLPDDQAGYPVRVLKDAISEGIMLVNGSSIYYDRSMIEYTYYHIETEEHSVVLADGMLTESYLDTGNRMNFKQHGDFAIFINQQSAVKNWEDDANAPLVVNRLYVEPLYNEIAQRAVSLGFNCSNSVTLTEDSDLHLVTDHGDILRPLFQGNNRYSFALPKDVNFVYLKSRTSRPCDIIGSFIDDRRELGVLVGRVTMLTNNQHCQITEYLTEQNFSGWDVVEASPCRWTNGSALLNIVTNNEVAKRILVIEVLAGGPYLLEQEEEVLQQNIA